MRCPEAPMTPLSGRCVSLSFWAGAAGLVSWYAIHT